MINITYDFFAGDIKVVSLENIYTKVEDVEIFKDDNYFKVVLNNCKMRIFEGTYRGYEIMYAKDVPNQCFVNKELRFNTFKEIPEWFDMTYNVALEKSGMKFKEEDPIRWGRLN